MGPLIVHADMDAFYASVEQLDRPELRGKPIIVGGPGRRGVVTTASYEARPTGVGSAMPMAQALRLCPEAIVVPPRFERYVEASRQVMSAFRQFSPSVEPLSLDEAFIDMTGAEALFGDAEAIGRAIKRAVRQATGGLTVSVGVAPTKYVAKVASDFDKPNGLTVVRADEVQAFLHPLPIRALWGVGPKAELKLKELGLETIRDVADSDPAWLSEALGRLGRHIYDLSQGRDARVVSGGQRARSIGSERTFEHDVRGRAAIEAAIRSAADGVGKRLRKAKLHARGVRVKLRTSDFKTTSKQRKLNAGSSNTKTLLDALLPLLNEFDLDRAYRLAGIAAFDLGPAEPQQGDLFATPADDGLDRTLDAIEERFGHASVVRGETLLKGGQKSRSPAETAFSGSSKQTQR